MPLSRVVTDGLFLQLQMAPPYLPYTEVRGKHAFSGFLVTELLKSVGSFRLFFKT